MKSSKLDGVSSEEINEVAKNLGVDLETDGSTNEKTEEESISETKTDTDPNATGNGDGDSGKNEVDYKKKYSESTKEFQDKYKPMEDQIKKFEQLSGKSLDDMVKEYEGKDENTEKKDTPNDEKNEVVAKLSSLEDKIDSMEKKVSEQEAKDRLSAKQQVDNFRGKYGMSEQDYQDKIYPSLEGIKGMSKKNGDPYTLNEALELSYVIANSDNIDKIVEKKLELRKEESDLSFSPKGSQDSSSTEAPKYSQAERDMAKKLGTSLEDESDGK